jgi:2-octaprenyl-6-methoxyphenol hydroxylase
MQTHAPARPGADAATHDVVVVGGGLVGASLAIALARIGVDVALVEATPPGALPAVFDQRNLSFADATVNALEALGVMSLLRKPAAAIRRIHVSRTGDFGRVLLEATDYGREYFGKVVVARDFGEALEARLASLSAITRYRPLRFTGLVDGGDARLLRLADADGGERVMTTRLLVAAVGARSSVRDALGIAAVSHDYAQTLFVARVRSARPADGTAWERFGDHGPTALLPRGDGWYGAVHGVASADADRVAALDDAAWLAHLQQGFGWRAGRFLETGPRSRYPALRVCAERLVADRAVLVGNAAQSLHPVGAQGFNVGLRDALTLAEVIDGAADPGADEVLQAHARRRAEDRARTTAFSDGLARGTAAGGSLARILRTGGLAAADRLPALQGWLVGGAMGYRGAVPRLSRGDGG